jgi:hypothetical protein
MNEAVAPHIFDRYGSYMAHALLPPIHPLLMQAKKLDGVVMIAGSSLMR